jgi:hypothetical protein
MVVVADTQLIQARTAGGLDATHETGIHEVTQRVVHRLQARLGTVACDVREQLLGARVRPLPEGLDDGVPGRGDPQPGAPQQRGRGRVAVFRVSEFHHLRVSAHFEQFKTTSRENTMNTG